MNAYKNNMIDARKRFRQNEFEYNVRIKVDVNANLILAIAKCLWRRKKLLITHTFTNDPIILTRMKDLS